MSNTQKLVGPPCFTKEGLRLRYSTIPPSPKQAAFLAMTCREALYGGAAGGGKSVALITAALQFADVPGYSALLLRRTLQSLKLADSLIPISKAMLAGTDAKWNGADYTWTFPSTATLQFGYLRNPGDELRYQGAQFQFVGFDELTQFPDEDQYLYLHSRLRRPVLEDREEMIEQHGVSPDGLTLADIPLRVRSATNPGGPGMVWVKRRFVKPETRSAPFLPSKMQDNPGLPVEEYRQSLAALSEVERRRLELGDWNVVEVPGALWRFSDIWHAERTFDSKKDFDVTAMAVDGTVSSGTGDECGIIIGGKVGDKVVVIADKSVRAHPDSWAKRAVSMYHNFGCTRLLIEDNQGGELNRMVIHNAADQIGQPRPHVILVKARETKEQRALPVSQAYRAKKVLHNPNLRDGSLEAQMTSWIPGVKNGDVQSPDRVDALVWLIRHLLFGDGVVGGGRTTSSQRDALSRW